jgi:hypothetical protein
MQHVKFFGHLCHKQSVCYNERVRGVAYLSPVLRSAPVKLNDSDGKGECRDAKTEWVELNIHSNVTRNSSLMAIVIRSMELGLSNNSMQFEGDLGSDSVSCRRQISKDSRLRRELNIMVEYLR